MEKSKKFSDALKTWRIQKGLTQAEVGDKMGISRSVISFLENGQQYPKMQHILAFKQYWGLDLSNMITDSEDVTNTAREPAPYFGSPKDLPQDIHHLMTLINNQREVRKDMSICIGLINDLKLEYSTLSFNAQKIVGRIQDIIIRAQLML